MEIEGNPQGLNRLFEIFSLIINLGYSVQIEAQSSEADEQFLETEIKEQFEELHENLSHYQGNKTYLSLKLRSGDQAYSVYMEVKPIKAEQ